MADVLRAPNGDPILIWTRMAQMLEALTEYTRVAVRAGRKVSKTYTAAIIALWWALTRPKGRVILTGPGYRTVQTELWRDIREIHRSASQRLELPRCSPSAEHGIQWDDGREIRGFTADKPEAASGTSGFEQLYIVDEASGVSTTVLDTIMGNLFGGGSILLLSNPTQPDGFFADVFDRADKRTKWLPLTISALESPNVVERRIVVPGLATLEAVQEAAQSWGEDSDLYRVHVLGQFPGQGVNSINGLALLMEAEELFDEPDEPGHHPVNIGVDVAREGDDDSVVVVRLGKRILPFEHGDCNGVVHGQRTTAVAGLALYLARKYHHPGMPAPRIMVDDTGVGGGVTDILLQAEDVTVVPVNASRVADDEEHYTDLRTQLWYAGRDFLRSGGKLPHDPQLKADLSSCHYGFDARGRFVAESKRNLKKRLGRSPDRADAFNLACYAGNAGTDIRDLEIPRAEQFRYASSGRGIV